MNAKQFRIVKLAVVVREKDAESIADQLCNISCDFGIYTMSATESIPTHAEWKEILENVPEEILGETDEQQRRDEKHGLYGDKQDISN